VVGLVLLRHLSWTLYVLVIGLFTADFLAGLQLIPAPATWIPEGILVLLTAALLYRLGVLGQPLCGSAPALDLSIAFVFVVGLLSAWVNATEPITVLLGLRAHFKYILLFYLLINLNFSTRLMQRLFGLFWGLMFIQPVFVAWQWLVSPCRNCYVDRYSGMLLTTAVLAMMTGLAAALGLSFYLERKDKTYLLLLMPLLFSLGLADAKAGFWFVAAVSAALLLYRVLVSRQRLKGLILPALLLGAGFYAALTFASRNLELDLVRLLANVGAVLEHDWIYDPAAGQEIGRTFDIQLALDTASRLPLSGVLGAGPGAGSPSIFEPYIGHVYLQVAGRIGRDVFWLQFGRVLVEFGYLGLLGFLSLFANLLLLGHRAYISGVSPYWKAVALSLVGFVVVLLAAHIYQTLQDVPNFILWFTAAMLIRHRREVAQPGLSCPYAESAA
jgi:hypothetical protein